MISTRRALSFISILLIVGLVTTTGSPAVASTQTDIVGLTGSGAFGTTVTVLSNGNFVVTDPYYDEGATADVGAVYLYDGRSGELINTLTGSTADDRVGDWVIALTNGNYVVCSRYWDNGMITNAGAVTWGDGSTGVGGVVSQANSLVGGTAVDQVGNHGVTALTNGNYVISSPDWDYSGIVDAGAVTWGDGTSGVVGEVSPANSLVGSTAGDKVGWVMELVNGNYIVGSTTWDNAGVVDAGAVTWGDGTTGVVGAVSAANSLVGSTAYDQVGWMTVLTNGNYVVSSRNWDNDGVTDAGAVTWGDGTSGITGVVSAANSLVGATAYDQVGIGGVKALTNGNYVVESHYWDNDVVVNAGAVTWGDGASGVSGKVSAANSLVGDTANDYVGSYGVMTLTNGNYVVRNPHWDYGVVMDAGAVTWGDGASGVTGEVNVANSLVGGKVDDNIGSGVVIALTNGNYVVTNPYWDNGVVVDAGAVTWGDGTTGVTGEVSVANSLVGGKDYDRVGSGGGIPLTNGNYVVSSPDWDYAGVVDAGAITWGDGTSEVTGAVSLINSLVGITANDYVGSGGVTALTNGNFVVCSPFLDNGGVIDVGAVTWGDGTSGVVGEVSPANSLVGIKANDWVGFNCVVALTNGSYVVNSPYWDNAGVGDAGAVTWGDGNSGVIGVVSVANSLVGGTADDQVGIAGVTALTNGNFVVRSPSWDNGATVDAGAVSWGNIKFPAIGSITADNSVRGTTPNGGLHLRWAYDDLNQQLVVGRPDDNIVTLFRLNLYPVADAGPDQTVMSGASVTLDGSSSSDPDGDLPLTYTWTQSGGTAVTLSSSSATGPSFTAPDVTQTSVLTFALVVSDSLGLSSLPDQVAITVEPYPLADAGPDQTVMSGATVILDGSSSSDPDGDLPLTYAWTQSSGTAVTLSSSSAAQPSFTAPVVTQTSVLTYALVVKDSLGLSSLPDQVAITVEPYAAHLPVILNRNSP